MELAQGQQVPPGGPSPHHRRQPDPDQEEEQEVVEGEAHAPGGGRVVPKGVEPPEHRDAHGQEPGPQEQGRQEVENARRGGEGAQEQQGSGDQGPLAADRHDRRTAEGDARQDREHLEERPQHEGEHHPQGQEVGQDQPRRGRGIDRLGSPPEQPSPGDDAEKAPGEEKAQHHRDRRRLVEGESAVLEHGGSLGEC